MNRIDALLDHPYLITSPIDIYYLTGIELSSGTLFLSKQGSALLVDGRYYEACRHKSPVPVHLAREGLLFELMKGLKSLWVDKDQMTIGAFLKLEEAAKKEGITVIPKESLTTPLRAIKDPAEIALLKEASELGNAGFDYVKSLLKPGIAEQEIAAELKYFWSKRGAQGVAFDPIIAFGASSSMPHYRASKGILHENDIALIDIGVKWKHYHSDMTRVVFFGTVDERLVKIHAVVKEAITTALSKLKAGVLIEEVDKAARDVIASHGFGEYFTHSLGHGVGLEIHEFPLIKSAKPYGALPLKAGMVITIEPGIYLPDIGGIRLEDTVLITAAGYENLTKRDYA